MTDSAQVNVAKVLEERDALLQMVNRTKLNVELMDAQLEADRIVINRLREVITELVYKWDATKREIPMRESDWKPARREMITIE